MQKIETNNILIVDDHKMFAESFCELLKGFFESYNIEQCYSVENARQKMLNKEYSYLFIDVTMPGQDTKGFIKECHKQHKNISILVISSITDPFTIKELFGFGINAFLSKSAGSHEIQLAIEATALGEKYISTNLAGKLATAIYVKNNNNLTKKELEILRLVAQGLTIAEAAAQTCLSIHTIVGYRRSIMQKLNIRSAPEMVKYAYENKLC